MTTHTTFETSRLLAEKGFPQPAPEFGQVWYLSGKPHVCIGHEGGGIYNFRSQKGMEERTAVNYPTYFFAPTATDILDRIGYGLIGQFFDGWIFCVQSPGGLKTSSNAHENPVEACAEAWLSLNK